MRCPKCRYISFDGGHRCRNCGYELSLSRDEPAVDVTIRRDEPGPGRVDEASLSAFDATLSGSRSIGELPADHDFVPSPNPLPQTADDLPLFTDRVADDQAPLITPLAVPRPPLSVRRANPGIRARSRGPLPEELSLDLEGPGDRPSRRRREPPQEQQPAATLPGPAGILRRSGAGLVDTVILTGVQAAVFYLTLRACELSLDQWQLLPLAPLAAFMLMLCGGYFTLFTAACGQTVGKMAAGIRVVAMAPDGAGTYRVSFRAAMIRAIACFGSVLLLGMGFLPVLFSRDRRAFHDRVAETRVVIV